MVWWYTLFDTHTAEVQRLIECKELPAIVKGSLETRRAMYTPLGYEKAQAASIASFYQLNGFIEYDKLKRMAMGDPRAYLKNTFAAGFELETCWLSPDAFANVQAAVEEAVGLSSDPATTAGVAATAAVAHGVAGWIHVTPLLPSPLSRADVALVLKRCIERSGGSSSSSSGSSGDSKSGKSSKSSSKSGNQKPTTSDSKSGGAALRALQLAQVYAVSDGFINGWCVEAVKPFVKQSVEYQIQNLLLLRKKKSGAGGGADSKSSGKGGDDDGEDGADDGAADDGDESGGDDTRSTTSNKSTKSTKSTAASKSSKQPAAATASSTKGGKSKKKAGDDDSDSDGADGGDDGEDAAAPISGTKARKLKRQSKAAKALGKTVKAPPPTISRQTSTSSSKGGGDSKSSKSGSSSGAVAITPETVLTIEAVSSELKKKWVGEAAPAELVRTENWDGNVVLLDCCVLLCFCDLIVY